nr:hypothetical protein CFP56_76579 [Quercus suber]
MSPHYFYIYFDGKAYINDLHGLSYRGPNQKQALIEVKHGIHMRKLKRKIMSTLALDKDSHDISIVFRAPQQMVGTQVFYNSIPLQCDNDVDIMWGVIKRAPQFIGSDLYVTIDTVGFNVDGGSQYASNAGQQESVPVTIVYLTVVTADTSLPYNVGPYNAVAMDNSEDAEVYTHENEDIQTNFDDAIEMDDTRDMYEEFIDNDGPEDNPEFLDEVEVENNVDACPNPNPIPDWFTSNTWDNIHDPSPSMETGNPLTDGGGQHTHRVDLRSMTCTCGKWEALKIPCSHVIAICAKHKHDAQQFIDPCYSVSHRYHTYEPVFQPLKDRLAWPDPEETRVVMPNPRLIRKKGQPKSTRICNEMDEDDNDRELPGSLWIENGPKSRCGLCHQEGHNRRTCPTRNVESTSGGDVS